MGLKDYDLNLKYGHIIEADKSIEPNTFAYISSKIMSDYYNETINEYEYNGLEKSVMWGYHIFCVSYGLSGIPKEAYDLLAPQPEQYEYQENEPIILYLLVNVMIFQKGIGFLGHKNYCLIVLQNGSRRILMNF